MRALEAFVREVSRISRCVVAVLPVEPALSDSYAVVNANTHERAAPRPEAE